MALRVIYNDFSEVDQDKPPMNGKSLPAVNLGPRSGAAVWRTRAGLYVTLTKAKLTAMVAFTTLVGFVLGARGPMSTVALVGTLIGTAVAAFGAAAFNQWMEVRQDRQMEHTCGRPLPARLMPPAEALFAAVGMLIAGPVILALTANLYTALLALASALVYLLLYTPLKTKTPLCTFVGAITGAIPPRLGWTAAAGRLEPGAWVLGSILFIWQIPHSLALLWKYRASYRRAGFRVFSAVDDSGRTTALIALLHCLMLVPVSLLAVSAGLAGWLYAACATAFGLALLMLSVDFLRKRTDLSARRLFAGSIVYLAVLMTVILADRSPTPRPAHPADVADAAPTTALIAAGGSG
jgi:protoheme IX farnesyltransferase